MNADDITPRSITPKNFGSQKARKPKRERTTPPNDDDYIKRLRDTLKMIQYKLSGIHGLTAYDNATEKSRHPKEHFKIDFTEELKAIDDVLGE